MSLSARTCRSYQLVSQLGGVGSLSVAALPEDAMFLAVVAAHADCPALEGYDFLRSGALLLQAWHRLPASKVFVF